MNKFLLLVLVLLFGVLAFALGLFSKGSSTALSQYVPDSVGEMFSKTTRSQTDSLKAQKGSDNEAIVAIEMPGQVNNSASSTTQKDESNEALIDIPATLVAEIQQDITPEPSLEALASIKQSVNEVKSENQVLKEKLNALNKDAKESDRVLEELEQQFKEKLGSQKSSLNERDADALTKEIEQSFKEKLNALNSAPNERDELLKELEKQIQRLNH